MIIGVMLMVPLAIVWALVSERDYRSKSVVRQIGGQWGPQQRLSGPFFIVPYRVEIIGTKKVEVVAGSEANPVVLTREEPDIREETRFAVFSPDSLKIEGDIDTEVRKRSIYTANVYTADLTLGGRFAPPAAIDSAEKIVATDWQDAQLVLGVSGLAGIERSDLALDGTKALLEPGPGLLADLDSGAVHAPDLNIDSARAAEGFNFALKLRLRGSAGLAVTPAGRNTQVALRSPWPHPGFSGRFLPKDREIGADGFAANWVVPHLARPLPVQLSLPDRRLSDLDAYSFGVNFVTPVDFYSLVDRALKYGLMFIAVVFMLVFALEISSGKRIHGMQYLLVGLMMVLFFLLLLAFAEHVGFAPAYLVASAATGLVLTVYVGLVFSNVARGAMAAISFGALYGVLYLILQMEDYALMAGSVLGFAILTGILFGTRKLDWSGRRDLEKLSAAGNGAPAPAGA